MSETERNEPLRELVIEARATGLGLDWRELCEYRDLLLLLMRREFLSTYAQTLLGPIWVVLQPLLAVVVFSLVFAKAVGLSTAGLSGPVFYLSGWIFFSLFAQITTTTASSLKTSSLLFSKVYFPRVIVPLALAGFRLTHFAVHLGLFVAAVAIFAPHPSFSRLLVAALALPWILGQIMALALGLGLFVAAVTVRYRDLQQVVTLVTQLWMYATPVLYPAQSIPERWRFWLYLNPLSAPVEIFRAWLFATPAPPLWSLALSTGMSALALVVGYLFFARVEGTFVDRI